MTREHKLALIVGFSLILLVGVLISDHLSKARLAKVSPVGATESAIADSNLPPTTDPLNVIRSVVAQMPAAPAPANPPTLAQQFPQRPADAQSSGPSTIANRGNAVQPMDPPTVLTQGHGAADPDAELHRQLQKEGYQLTKGPDGTIVALPPAAGVSKKTMPETGKSLGIPEPRATNTAAKPGPTTPDTLHKVEKGETLFMIASKYYGTGHVWRELAKYNGVENKNGSVRVGAQLKIPSKDILLGKAIAAPQNNTATVNTTPTAKPAPGKKPEVAPTKPARIELATYTVKKGDTLGVISQKVLGTSKRWEEIAELNKIDDEASLAAGTILKVPPMRG